MNITEPFKFKRGIGVWNGQYRISRWPQRQKAFNKTNGCRFPLHIWMMMLDFQMLTRISKLLHAYFLRIMRIFLFTQKIRSSVVCVNKTRSRIFCVFSAYFLRISCVQNDISAYIIRIFYVYHAYVCVYYR